VTEPDTDASADQPAEEEPAKKGRIKRMLLPIVMRYAVSRRAIGIQWIYRDTGGGLITGGLAYAALFALIPTIVLVLLGLTWLIDDPVVRNDAVDLVNRAFPAFVGVTKPVVDASQDFAAVGAIIAVIGFAWGASGLYLNLVRAMERFFPGERVSGVLARIFGVLLVVIIIIGVLAAVFVAGVVTVIARALNIDSEWLLSISGAIATLAVATALVYAVYRLLPANPPSPRSARLPAVLVGVAVGLMTLLYSLISPWLVSGYAAYGIFASVFVALVWLRVVFLAMTYGAAMARYSDYVALAAHQGEAEPDRAATSHVLSQEQQLAQIEAEAKRAIESSDDDAAETSSDRGASS
jgi:uncharacterized BrkB/YihY/UPF0761 family membrane protein